MNLERVAAREKLAYILHAARLWSEITILFGMLIILYLILRKII